MDFARKQLEKYGWTDGKGLGRHENGISEAIKPKLKRSAAGIGHDPASEFNEHWWTALYDKAAGNVEVQEKNGRTKKIRTKDDFQITNSTWKLKQQSKDEKKEEQYSEFFVRTAVLTSGGTKVEKVKQSDSEEEEKRDVCNMTDEELFKACGGRTAHKGARHGLKAIGKLARIAQQEALLLTQSRFNGYSHTQKEKHKVVEEINLNSDSEVSCKKKKKKKRKRCYSNEKLVEHISETTEYDNVTSTLNTNCSRKSKKSKRKISNSIIELIPEEDEDFEVSKKNKIGNGEDLETLVHNNTEDIYFNESSHKIKRKKKKMND